MVQQQRAQLLEELRKAEQARDLLRDLEPLLAHQTEEKGLPNRAPREATGAAGTNLAGGPHRAAGDRICPWAIRSGQCEQGPLRHRGRNLDTSGCPPLQS